MNNFDEELIKKYVPFSNQEEALVRLKKGYPVQYLIGNVEFYGNIIKVNENVLIPRFETEYLVDDLLKIIKTKSSACTKILDVGTGSGCIAIALKKSIDCNVTAIDISAAALDVAKENALVNDTKIEFICCPIEEFEVAEKYDVIVSNPPYVPFDSNVDEKIKYEPQNAIYAKDNGLYFYKIILKKCEKLLKPHGVIAFEIGDNQAGLIKNIAKDIFPKAEIIAKKDLNNYDRYIYIINE